MTIDSWLEAAVADAARRGLLDMKAGLEALARASAALRAADFNLHATGETPPPGSAAPPAGARGAEPDDRAQGGRRP
jgi:hypothetical protein